MTIFHGRIELLAKPASDWAANDAVLRLGEIGVSDPATLAPILKVGDGVRPFSVLPPISGAGGAVPNYVVGSTTTLAPGSFATVTIDNAAIPPTISFGIPTGAAGPPNSLAIGTVTTGAPATPAAATITGTAPAQTLNLTIPQGAVGPAGIAGADGASGPTGADGPANSLAIGTVTTGTPGTPAAATITGTPPSQVLNLTIPAGADGAGTTLAAASGTIGLTAVAGSGTNAMRSDSTAPLSQAIAPTWTAQHIFALNGALAPNGSSVKIAAAPPYFEMRNTAAVADQGRWINNLTSTNWQLFAADDAGTIANVALRARRLLTAITVLEFGNTTNNNDFNLLGTGNTVIDGQVIVGGATGGAMGAGTVNAKAFYDDGVLIANQSPANPSAVIGLTAVNGSAISFMRSDAAPALSQAIAPTWTGAHVFSASVDLAGPLKASTVEGISGQVLSSQGAGLPAIWRTASGGSIELGYNFNTSTAAANPGSQKLAYNNAAFASVTAIYFNITAFTNFDASTILSLLQAGNRIYMQQRNDASKAVVYQVTGPGTNNTGWWTIPVAMIDSRGTPFPNNADLNCVFILSVSASASANPTATVGLAAVNGSATTWMRSDAAPPLDQSIAPTWTGLHRWNGANPFIRFTATGAAADKKTWDLGVLGSDGSFNGRHLNDAESGSTSWLVVVPNGTSTGLTSITLGIPTAMTYSFPGVGGATFACPVTAASRLYAIDGAVVSKLQSAGSASVALVGTESNHDFAIYTNNVSRATFAANGSTITITPRLLAPLGSAAAPSYSFSAAGNAGMYATGDNALYFAANGAVGLLVDPAGARFCPFQPVQVATDGSATAPSYSWTSEINTGMYRYGAGVIGFTTAGVVRAILYSGAFQMASNCRVYLADGDISGPGLGFAADTDTGLYRVATNNLRINAGAIDICGFANGSGIAIIQPFGVINPISNGSLGAPIYSFNNDPATGIFLGGVADLRFSVAGTLYCAMLSSGTPRVSMQKVMALQDGTAGIPGLMFENDTDTGIYRNAANEIDFTCGGVTKMAITTTSFALGASMTALFQGAVTAPSYDVSSARAIKRETGAPARAADILARLRPIFYRLLADESREQLGLIAEEVHELCPQLSDGKTVSYDRLALLLLADWQDRHAAAA